MARLHAERSWGDIDSTLTPRQVQLLQKGGAFKRGPTGARAGGGAGGWRKATRAAVGATVSRRQPKGSLLQNVRQKTGAEHAAIRPQSMKQARNFKPELQPAPPAPLQITLTADGRLAKVSTDGGSRSPRQPTILLRTQSLDIDSYSVAVPPRTASSPRSRLRGTVSAVAPRHIMRALSLDDTGPPSSPRSPKIVPAARPTGLPGTPTSSRPAALGTVFGKMQRPDPAAEPSEEESPDARAQAVAVGASADLNVWGVLAVDQMLLARLIEVASEKLDDNEALEEQKNAKALKQWHNAVSKTIEENRLKKVDERKTKSTFHLISRRDMKKKVAQMQEEIMGKPSPPKSSAELFGSLESVAE